MKTRQETITVVIPLKVLESNPSVSKALRRLLLLLGKPKETIQ